MTDLLCLDDVDALGREVGARDAYIQDMYHRLIEEPGSNLDDPDRGLGIIGWLSAPYNDQWPGMIAAECMKDDRTANASATLTPRGDGGFLISLELTTNDDEISLDIAVDAAAGVELTEVP